MAAASDVGAENSCTVFDVLKTINSFLEENSLTYSDSLLNSISTNVKILTSEIIKPLNCNKFPDDGIPVIVKALESSSDVNNDIHIQLRAEIFRFLRNLCSLGKYQQAKIADSNLIQISKETALAALEGNSICRIPMYQTCLRCVIQFWGNLVVNNSDNKKLIWFELKHVFRKLLSVSTDDLLINYVTMLLYNCLHNEQTIIQELFDDSDLFFYICNFLIRIASEKDIEWGLYTLLSLMGSDNFLRKLYKELSNERRLFLLEVLKLALDEKRDQVNRSNISFLAEELKQNWNDILKASETDYEQCDPIILLKMLDILCAASILDDYKVELQKDIELLSTVVYLLKSVHQLGKESVNNFTPIVKLSAAANPEEVGENPANGMKRDLVRLIGNLCWKCERNQDHVRELDGIPILLECCNIDARNPFIIQWGIFALRNLCENNLENQNIIRKMEKLESGQSNVSSQIEENTTNEASASTTSDSGTMSRNLEDIEALFE